jgi:anti-sigma factor RsiW
MRRFACLWNRRNLERYVDGALGPRATRLITAHLPHCRACLRRTEGIAQFRRLVAAAVPEPEEPDWGRFWAGVRQGIAQTRRPMKEPWWLPFWKPFWGHPRLAVGAAMAAALATVLTLWPERQGPGPAGWGGSVSVQEVATDDPDHSVMVYSNREHDLTVIWLFGPEGSELKDG